MSSRPAAQDKKSRKKKILLLNNSENYDVFGEFLRHTLGKLGCDVTESLNWSDFLGRLGKSKYDVALLDPRAEGYSDAGLQEMKSKANGDGLPQMISIRLHEEDDQEDFEKKINAKAYIFKTFLPHQLYFTFMRLFSGGGENLRKTPRALSSFAVEYRGLGSHEWKYDRCFNISEGGLFLQSYRNRGHAGFLNLILHLPDRALPLQCEAKVVHRRKVKNEDTIFPPGMGLQFINMGDVQDKRISEFVSEHLFAIDYSS